MPNFDQKSIRLLNKEALDEIRLSRRLFFNAEYVVSTKMELRFSLSQKKKKSLSRSRKIENSII